MAMAKGKGGEGVGGVLVALGLLVLAGVVYYSETGKGEENDSALIPNDIEGRIDFLVGKLNTRFTPWWVDLGFDFINSYVQRNYPALALVVQAVVQVEQRSKGQPMSSYAKKQAAVQIARRLKA
jgi:hypothetical protein